MPASSDIDTVDCGRNDWCALAAGAAAVAAPEAVGPPVEACTPAGGGGTPWLGIWMATWSIDVVIVGDLGREPLGGGNAVGGLRRCRR